MKFYQYFIDIEDERKIDLRKINLLIPYDEPEWDVGYWSERSQCYRFTGDDGANDIQPIGWLPIIKED